MHQLQKPLFIPLTSRYFAKFERGDKDTEYRRPGGPWNPDTCPAGRAVVLSCGYGTQRRLQGVITGSGVRKVKDLEYEDRKDVQAVYGPLCREVFWIGIDLAKDGAGQKVECVAQGVN